MLIAYLDESYNKDFYYIAAAVAPVEAWEELEISFAEIKRKTSDAHGTPIDAELHGHEIMGGEGEWAPLRGKHREAAGIYIAALRQARAAGISYLFRGVDINRLNARYKYPEQPHSVVLGHLLERIDDHAHKCRETDQVIVVADQVATQDVHKKQFEGYQLTGTPGYRSNKLARISTPINFASSRHSAGLQAADLAAYLHHRRNTVVENHPAARSAMRRLVKEVLPSTVHDWTWIP
ncbi:DUF3800 domain-containing protein [Cryobacterium sp. PAMC25264]|uniref:DUF3800 domain-containing protein n=1 Tax=Cryobacterium sp. PAMC25264 TaxID=2861288 RepID=UPI001C63AF1B|nr:DUF3800 domain-containing protein [Cryobacterium sp. PAMC25264]QYF73321.1 DUF3800 domain-containing protein [Cryobacterium sp. PAMC25264]